MLHYPSPCKKHLAFSNVLHIVRFVLEPCEVIHKNKIYRSQHIYCMPHLHTAFVLFYASALVPRKCSALLCGWCFVVNSDASCSFAL